MHILVEPSEYNLLNIGDMAMQQVALSRIAALWPRATIQVLTDTPQALPNYAANVSPLSAVGRRVWAADGYLFWGYRHYRLPQSAITWERRLRRRQPRLAERFVRTKMKVRGLDEQSLTEYLEAARKADLLVICGMGAITDAFAGSTFGLLETIALAKTEGRAFVAMFGQGIGPIANRYIEQRAREVLPRVDFIAVREGLGSEPLLRRLGVAPERVVVTGDDALEVAYRPGRLPGDGIGINLRATPYAQVSPAWVPVLRSCIVALARKYSAPLVPVPTSLYPQEADAVTLELLLGIADGAKEVDSPDALIAQLQRCRVLVTGSYHAGIFALAQGVPIVGLYNSAYYRDKFFGMAAQFGAGVQVVDLSDSQRAESLASAVQHAWECADAVRPQLLAAAARQIQAGHDAYRRVFELFGAAGGGGGC